MTIEMIIGTIIGAVLGLLYYKLVGCPNGSCPITSNPHRTAIYGAFLGLIIRLLLFNNQKRLELVPAAFMVTIKYSLKNKFCRLV